MLTSTTSLPAFFSFTRSPSSTAISSKGFTTHLILSVTKPVPSALILSCVSGSGTRFTVTRIFTGESPLGGIPGPKPDFATTGVTRSQGSASPTWRGCGSRGAWSPSDANPRPWRAPAAGGGTRHARRRARTEDGKIPLRAAADRLPRRASAGLALPDVEAEAARQIPSRLHDQRRKLLVDALRLEAIGRTDDGERADDVARVVPDRDRHRAHVFHVLTHVDRVSARADRLELLLENLPVSGRPLGELGQGVGQQAAQVFLGLEGEQRLARSGAVQGQGLAHLRDDAHRPIGFDHLDGHDAVAPQDRNVGGLARLAHQLDHDRPGLTQEPHVLDVALAELQAADAQAVVLGAPVLLDVATRFEGSEQPEDVVLVQLEALGQLGDAQLVGVLEELLEHVERVRHRLDDVIGFLPSHRHVFPKTRFRLRRWQRGVNEFLRRAGWVGIRSVFSKLYWSIRLPPSRERRLDRSESVGRACAPEGRGWMSRAM